DGGAIFNYYASSPELYNSIVWGNGELTPIAGSDINESSSHNLIEGGHHSNLAGIPADLAAADIFSAPTKAEATPTTEGDYTLKAGSPAVNVGSNRRYEAADGDAENENPLNDHDLNGKLRLMGGIIDLGACESAYDNLASVGEGEVVEVALGTDWTAV